MPESNYGAMLSQGVKSTHKLFVALVVAVATGLSFLYAGVFGLVVAGTVVVGYSLAIRFVSKNLQGISGDLLGYAMVVGEVCGLVALAVLQAW